MELKSLFPKGRPCQREQVGCPDARWSQQVLGGHWGDWGSAGLGFSRCVLWWWRRFPPHSAFWRRSTKFPKPSAASHGATRGLLFSLSWSGQRQSSSAGGTCKKLEDRLGGSEGGQLEQEDLYEQGSLRRQSPQLGFPSHQTGFCNREIYNFNKEQSIVRCLWLFCCLGEGKERCPI